MFKWQGRRKAGQNVAWVAASSKRRRNKLSLSNFVPWVAEVPFGMVIFSHATAGCETLQKQQVFAVGVFWCFCRVGCWPGHARTLADASTKEKNVTGYICGSPKHNFQSHRVGLRISFDCFEDSPECTVPTPLISPQAVVATRESAIPGRWKFVASSFK